MTGLFHGKMSPGSIGCIGACFFVAVVVIAMLGMVWIVGNELEVF